MLPLNPFVLCADATKQITRDIQRWHKIDIIDKPYDVIR